MKKAFTLIELLVVIAIIAILAAILFPVFAQAKSAAKQSSSLSNVKQIMTSMMIYTGDYDDLQVPTIWQNRGDGEWTTWMETIHPYVKNTQIFQDGGAARSPSQIGVNTCTGAPGAQIASNYAVIDWIKFDYWNWFGTVMFAGFPVLPTAANTATCNDASRPWSACIGLNSVADVANTAYIVPGYMVTYPRPGRNNTFGWPCTTGFAPNHGKPTPTDKRIQVYRDGGNYGFADSHAKWFSSPNMNGNASRPHPYNGANYPGSPYMVIQN